MDWGDFAGKKVGLLGAGSENLALLPFLVNAGAKVTVADQADEPAVRQKVGQADVTIIAGTDYLRDLANYDVVFRISGLPTAALKLAMEKTAHPPLVTSAINLFLENCPCPIIGVTGTKGKGTTTTMIARVLEQTGRRVLVGGNIETPVFSFFAELTKDSLVVLELSSFQLEDVTHSPAVAVMLPITQDHLQPLSASNPNFHPTLANYELAKANLTAFQDSTDLLIYAADSATTRRIAEESSARRISVGRSGSTDLRYDLDGRVFERDQELINLATAPFRGGHLYLDATLAIAVGREFDLTPDQILSGLNKFEPLPHRLQTVGKINGITYVDDSYATAPDAAISAILAFPEPIVWIGGGSRKGADFTELGRVVGRSSVKGVVLMGEEAERIAAALPSAIRSQRAESMAEAVALAQGIAKPGDIILLSPACASKDMFTSAADRGDQFQRAALNE